MPRISVIMPVFNAERYLSAAVDSILSQTYGDFELLLFDDGSTDQSSKIAQKAAARDTRVILVNGGHRGVVHWRNAGVDMAKSEFVAMMDSDDISAHDRLAYQVQFLEAHPKCCAVGTQAIRIDRDGLPINEWRVPEHHYQIDEDHMTGRGGAIINPSVMMQKSAVRRVGGYRSGFDSAEDYDLFLRLAEVGQLANLPQPLLQYRVHAKSLTFALAEAQRRRARRAQEDAWARRKREGPLPPPAHDFRSESEEELMWTWARSAFDARNFHTARRQALGLLRRRPAELRGWILFSAACLGPLALQLKRVCPNRRLGKYRSPKEKV
jgi:glycosyltransferase involved in cell wall biosynthesis